MITFAAITKALQLAGVATPAFKALFDQVLPLLTSGEQDELKALYAQARQRSDAAHAALQDEVREIRG